MPDKLQSSRKRILALDLIRGLFLVVIICDHIAWTPSLFFQFVTSNTGSFASAAEGFFAVSGILVGYIYGPRFLATKYKMTMKIWSRAALLYILASLFTIFFAIISLHVLTTPYPRLSWADQSMFEITYKTLTLQYSYGLADFLSRYAVFMTFAPLAVWLVAKGRAWVVALVSFAVWLVLHDKAILTPFPAWQIIFMFGIIVGYYLPQIEVYFKRNIVLKKLIIISAVVSFTAFALWSIVPNLLMSEFGHIIAGMPHDILTRIEINRQLFIAQYFRKDIIDVGRLCIGVLWFATIYILFRQYEKNINSATRGFLEFFGKNSLLVYSLHAFVIFGMDIFIPAIPGMNIIINTIINIAVVVFIYFLAYFILQQKKTWKDRNPR